MVRINGNIELDGVLNFPSGQENTLAIRAFPNEVPGGEAVSGQIRFLSVGNQEGYWYLQNHPAGNLNDFDAGTFPSGQRIATLEDVVRTLNGVSGQVTLSSTNDGLTITGLGQDIEFTAQFTSASGALINDNLDQITANLTFINDVSGLVAQNISDITLNEVAISTLSGLVDQNAADIVSLSGSLQTALPVDVLALSGTVSQNSQNAVALSGLTDGLPRTQTTVNTWSGAVILIPADESISIAETPQTLEFSGLFNAASGALLDQRSSDMISLSGVVYQNLDDILVVSGLATNAALPIDVVTLSGIVTQNSQDVISLSGQIISLDGQIVAISGVATQNTNDIATVSGLVDATIADINALSGLTDGLPRTQTSINGISGVVTQSSPDSSIAISTNGQDIQLSGLFNAASGIFIDTLQAQSGLYMLKEANLLDVENQREAISNIGLDFVNGFVNRTDSTISIDEATRTFTIEPTVSGGSYVVWSNSTRFTKTTAESIQWDNSDGTKFFYFDDNGNLSYRHDFNLRDLLLVDAYISNIYWNSTSGVAVIWGDERHGLNMDTATHVYLHTSFGARLIDGGALGNILADQTGDDPEDAQLSVGSVTLRDEDILIQQIDGQPQVLSPIAQLPVLWREGASGIWFKAEANDYPIMYGGRVPEAPGARASYNQLTGGVWQLTEVSNNDFLLMHILATNDVEEGVVAIVGQEEYAGLGPARDGAVVELNNLITEGLPIEEWVPLGTVIFQTSDGFDNIPKSEIRSVDGGGDYIDWRNTDLTRVGVGSSSASDHGNLTGLSDDDHPQYLLVNGLRAMDQDLNLGTHKLINVVDPTDPQDGATKAYVDSNVGEIPVDAREASGSIIPDTTRVYDLGSLARNWDALFARRVSLDDISLVTAGISGVIEVNSSAFGIAGAYIEKNDAGNTVHVIANDTARGMRLESHGAGGECLSIQQNTDANCVFINNLGDGTGSWLINGGNGIAQHIQNSGQLGQSLLIEHTNVSSQQNAIEIFNFGDGDSIGINNGVSAGRGISIANSGIDASLEITNDGGAVGVQINQESDARSMFIDATDAAATSVVSQIDNASTGDSLLLNKTGGGTDNLTLLTSSDTRNLLINKTSTTGTNTNVFIINNANSPNVQLNQNNTTTTTPNLLMFNEGLGRSISISHSNTSAGEAAINIENGTSGPAIRIDHTYSLNTTDAVFIDNDADSRALNIDQRNTSSTATAVDIDTTTLGRALVVSSSNGNNTNRMVDFDNSGQANALAVVQRRHDVASAIFLQQVGTTPGNAHGLQIVDNNGGGGYSISIEKNAGNGGALNVSQAVSTPSVFLNHTDATFNQNGIVMRMTRAGSSLYNFATFQSAAGADNEYVFRGDGTLFSDGGGAFSPADYAEYFESVRASGIPAGFAVQLAGAKHNAEKIIPANDPEKIIGIVSAKPAIVADAAWDRWKDKYLKNDMGGYQLDPSGNKILNPVWNSGMQYIPRQQRPEWQPVGMLGKLWVRCSTSGVEKGDWVTLDGSGIFRQATQQDAQAGTKVWRAIDAKPYRPQRGITPVRILFK